MSVAAYDIGEAFQIIEEEMIASMARNLKRHLKTEHEEGLNYSMWQAEQLASLNNFRKNNKKKFTGYFSTINGQIEDVLRKAYETGEMDQEAAILEAIRSGAKIYNYNAAKSVRGQFFTINERKLNALIKATKKDMAKAETAMLRMADDEYRKIIFNSQVYYNTGAGTLSQCVDMATKDFLSKGINCIEYANGARVTIDSYASMALRTTQTRAYLHGESSKRDEWGVNTVIVNKRGVACPRCLRYVGRVFYDDVWGNVPVPSPAKYPRLSDAIAGGLYHPNCKDIHTTYFEGITTPPKPMTEAEKKEAARIYDLEQRQRYNERQIRKYKRLYSGSVDAENKTKYLEKLEEWQARQKSFVKANGDVLKRRYENEKLRVADFPEPPRTISSKDIDFSKNSDIMETDISMKRSVNGVEIGDPMPHEQFERIQKAAEKNGIAIISNEESERYVLGRGAEGITLNAYTICLMRNPSRVAVFEELIHATQYRLGIIDGTSLSRAKAEVLAKEKLLKYSKAYGLTDVEIENTKKILASDRLDVERLMKGE
jgi:hypothetical protein